jgi:hypothetical protein
MWMISKYPPMMEKILANYKLIKLKATCCKSQTKEGIDEISILFIIISEN